jgi:PAS domain-containing protein
MATAGRLADSLSAPARAVLDALPDGVAVFDADNRACYVNRAWIERGLTELTDPSSGLSGESADAAPAQGGPQPLISALERLRATGRETSLIVEMTATERAAEAFELRLRLLPGEQCGAADAPLLLVQARDITQQLRTERAHREAESLLGAVLETADVGLCLIDQHGRFVSVNRGYCELFGYRPEELIGRRYSKVLPSEEQEHAERRLQSFMSSSDPPAKGGSAGPPRSALEEMREERGRRKDGSTLYLSISARILIRENGRRFAVLSVVDITGRKEQARELEERASHARAEADEKTQLLHELDARLALISRQHHQILDLSAPILDLWDGVLVLPLIGALTAERAAAVTERLLEAVAKRRARFVLLDLTSASEIESKSAEHIVRMISAVRLLGSQALLTGLSSTTARRLAECGPGLAGIRAMRSLADGLRECLR